MPRLYVVLSTTGTDHAVDQRPRSKPIVFTRPERGGKRRHSRDHPPRQAGRSDRTLLCAAVARTRASDRASRRTHACGPAPGRTALQPRRDARTVISLDTNILIYSVDRGAGDRHEAAAKLVERSVRTGNCLQPLQSLCEFYNVATRKTGLDAGVASELVARRQSAVP